MKPEEFLKTTLTDIKVKITDAFDKNFERKGFFGKKWSQSKRVSIGFKNVFLVFLTRKSQRLSAKLRDICRFIVEFFCFA